MDSTVTIARPIDGTHETFHVHCAGCKDLLNRRKYRNNDDWTITVQSFNDVVMDVYPPDDFCYDPATEIGAYAGDFKVFPCAQLAQ